MTDAAPHSAIQQAISYTIVSTLDRVWRQAVGSIPAEVVDYCSKSLEDLRLRLTFVDNEADRCR